MTDPGPTDVATRWYEAVNAGDLDRALKLLSPDVIWISPPDVPRPGTYAGRDQVREMWRAFTGSFSSFRIVPGEMSANEGRVIAPVRIEGIVTASGSPFEMRGAQVLDIGGEVVRSIREFLTLEEAVQAAARPLRQFD